MRCPKCKAASEVLETRHTRAGIRRRRRCLSPRCEQRFTTTESMQNNMTPSADEATLRAQALAKEFSSRVIDKDALAAALAVDMRRAQIAREQKAQRRAERDVWYDDDSFEPAPSHLNNETLKRELGED